MSTNHLNGFASSGGTAIAWTNLVVSVKSIVDREEKVVLNGIGGKFEFGCINGVMGCPGSGKSTLLKTLNASNKYRLIGLSNIWVPKETKITKCFIYADHEHRVMSSLTVRQALTYASRLKNPTYFDRSGIVDQVMTDLMISEVADIRVAKCSADQIKRFCVGLEMTSAIKPNLMFVDKPTTGLDISASEIFVNCLKKLAHRHNMSIVISIDHPNQDLFLAFDNVYVLAKGGVCVYWGPPKPLRRHLADCDIECPRGQAIEELIKIAFCGVKDENVSTLWEKARQQMRAIASSDLEPQRSGLRHRPKKFQWKDFFWLLVRFIHRDYIAQFVLFIAKLVAYSCVLLFTWKGYNVDIDEVSGCFTPMTPELYLNLTIEPWRLDCYKLHKQKSMTDQNENYLYITQTFATHLLSVIVGECYVNDLKIFMSEYVNRWYSFGVFFWAKFISDLIKNAIFLIVCICIVVFAAQELSFNDRMAYVAMSLTFNFITNQLLTSIIAIIFCKSVALAVLFTMFVNQLGLFFANYLFLLRKIPRVIQRINDINYQKYLFNSLIIAIYGFGRCPDGEENAVLLRYRLRESRYLFWRYIYGSIGLVSGLFVANFFFLWLKAHKVDVLGRLKLTWVSTVKNEIKELLCRLKRKLLSKDEDDIEKVIASESDQVEPDRVVMIAWVDLNYAVTERKLYQPWKTAQRFLLDNISGHFESSTLNAVMGPSGAGKATFMRLMNAKNLNRLTDDSKLLVSKERTPRMCFIVENVFDHLFHGFTAKQTLLYACKLKNSREKNRKELDHKQIVSQLLAELMISDTADTKVESCSGGEQRLIVVAAELTAQKKPNIMCIEEPTSGLDSFATEMVIQTLKRLSRSRNLTIIVSIRQPNQEVFHTFDSVYVLGRGGVNVYAGPPDHLRQHLYDCQVACTRNQLPIEVLLKVSAEGKSSWSVVEMILECSRKRKEWYHRCMSEDMTAMRETKSKWFWPLDVWTLVARKAVTMYITRWKLICVEVFAYYFIGIILIVCYEDKIIKPKSCNTLVLNPFCGFSEPDIKVSSLIRENLTYHMIFLMFTSGVCVIFSVILFHLDYKISVNEKNNGWYSSGAYMCSATASDMIRFILIIFPLLWMINQYKDWRMFGIYFTCIFWPLVASDSIGQITAIIFSDNINLALVSGFCIVVFWQVMGNMFVMATELNDTIEWMSQMSYFKFCWEMILDMIYNRCHDGLISMVHYKFDIEYNNMWGHMGKLKAVIIPWKALAFITYIVKNNPLVKRKVSPRASSLNSLSDSVYTIDKFSSADELVV